MDFHEAWALALQNTEIIRTRAALLHTFADTQVPYVLLSSSLINEGDTVVRRGKVTVQRPAIFLPPNVPQFEGFDFLKDGADSAAINFLLIRGISLPSLHYSNETMSLDVVEGGVREAAATFANQLERQEDVATGLMIGHEEAWPLSLLIFTCSQITRNTEVDLKRLMDEYRRKGEI